MFSDQKLEELCGAMAEWMRNRPPPPPPALDIVPIPTSKGDVYLNPSNVVAIMPGLNRTTVMTTAQMIQPVGPGAQAGGPVSIELEGITPDLVGELLNGTMSYHDVTAILLEKSKKKPGVQLP